MKISLTVPHKSENQFPIFVPNSLNQFPTSENQLPKLVPRLEKNSPILFTTFDKPSVKLLQKLEKKSPTDVASSLILSGIELTAFQILLRIPEELSSLFSLSVEVSPPLVLPSLAPPSVVPPVELPEKPVHL